MQINPITEMKADLTVAKVLQRDLHSALKDKQKAVRDFYVAKEKSETTACEPAPPVPPPPPRSTIADQEKEQQLLQMAKARYQDYKDVAIFANELGLRAGIVYLALKHHGFIKQNETTEYRVLDAYYKSNGNLREITEQTQLTVWICSQTLQKLGIAPNWASYKERGELGSYTQGGWAEEEFKRLVPSAVDMNMQYRMNNPRFDFIVNEKEIDVKFSTKRQTRGNNWQYVFRYNPDNLPDFFCLFCSLDKSEDNKAIPSGYRILLIPKEILPSNKKQLVITATEGNERAASAMYWDFEVQPAALSAMLGEL